MAFLYDRGYARVEVQVVATLLPLNIPVHVDPFWTLLRFSETQRIRDVENKLIACLNSMAKKCPVELAVHGGPISPSWTYVPVSGNNTIRAQTYNKKSMNNISGVDADMEQLTILLKPPLCHIPGTKKTIKPASPVLMSYDLSHFLKESVRLVFRRQLVFMRGCVLLGDSQSEILRDNDVVIINAICGFLVVNHASISSGLSCEAKSSSVTSSEAEVNLNSHQSAAEKDVDENSLFWDIDEENGNDHERELSSEIKRKIDKLLKKLASLKHLHKHDGKGCMIKHKKSKKRKANEEDSGTEVSNACHEDTNKTDCTVQKQKKKSTDEQRTQNENETKVSHGNETKISHANETKVSHGNETKISHANEINMSHANETDMLFSRSRKKSKKKHEREVSTHDMMDTSVTHSTDEIQKSHKVPHSNGRNQDEVDCPAVNTIIVSLPKKNIDSTHQAIKSPGFGLSGLLCALRNQQDDESRCNEHKQKPDMVSEEIKQRLESAAPMLDKATVNPTLQEQQLVSAQATPKRKRVRKRKNKKLHSDKNTSIEQNLQCIDKDYSLRLPEHHMPQNSRVTFECDSEDDSALMNQTVGTVESNSLTEQHEHSHTLSSVTGSDKKPSQLEGDHKSAVKITPKSEVAKVIFNKAGAPIDPDGKFQALLHQYGNLGRQFETTSSNGGHTVIRSSRQKRNPYKSHMADFVDPERDVLTNVSIITQHIPTAETSASDKTSASDTNSVQYISSAAGDHCENLLPQIEHERLPSNYIKSENLENKSIWPHVEVTPVCMNYDRCQKLCGFPMESDIIAYKILELSEDYTPGLSKFKEAKIVNVDTQTGSLVLEPRGGKDNRRRSGRFELSFDDVRDNPNNEEDNHLATVNLSDLIDPRLVSRSVVKE